MCLVAKGAHEMCFSCSGISQQQHDASRVCLLGVADTIQQSFEAVTAFLMDIFDIIGIRLPNLVVMGNGMKNFFLYPRAKNLQIFFLWDSSHFMVPGV